MTEQDPYIEYVETKPSPALPLMERQSSRMRRFQSLMAQSGNLWHGIKFGIKFGGTLGFATGVIMGVATFRTHKSWLTVVAQGVGMSIFVASLMTAGNLLSAFDTQDQHKLKFAYMREFNLESQKMEVRDEPFWVEFHQYDEEN